MLQLTPRRISGLIILIFVALLGTRHISHALLSQQSVTKKDIEAAANYSNMVPLLNLLENADYDFHLRARTPRKLHSDVAIVEIGEPSLQKLGQFPFPRRIYTSFLEAAERGGAKVVAFDIVFSERETNESIAELTKLKQRLVEVSSLNEGARKLLDTRIAELNGDDEFARSIRNSKVPIVLGFAFGEATSTPEQMGWSLNDFLANHTLRRVQLRDDAYLHDMSEMLPVFSLPALLQSLPAHSTVGAFIPEIDHDSVIRRAVVAVSYKKNILGSLPVQAVARYLNTSVAIVREENNFYLRDKDQSGKIDVPITSTGSIWPSYYGGDHLFPYVQFSEVVDPNTSTERLKELIGGKILFVGATAAGLKDIRANPYSKDYPGVEVHATVASNILHQDFMAKDGRFFLFGYLMIIGLGALISWITFRAHPAAAFLLTGVAILVMQFLAQTFAFNEGVVVPTVLPSIQFIVLLFAGVLHRYFSQEKEKKFVRNALGRYVSGPVVEEILKDQSKLRLGGQKKVMTVMFCDMVGFTKLSEGMDAGALTQRLNQFFTRMTTVILKNHGTLDKYMGDAIMCFWGAPLDDPKHAHLACHTALEMLQELDSINAEWVEKYGFSIGVRIGINTGEMSVGNMGSDQVFSYTVLGDNVNLGSRLEGVNNVYGTTLLVSHATYELTKDTFAFRHLDRVQVKGKEGAIDIYELIGLRDHTQPEWLRFFELGLEHYRKAQWNEAEAAFKACQAQKPGDIPTKIFLQRVEELKAWPPEAWDGVWKLTAK